MHDLFFRFLRTGLSETEKKQYSFLSFGCSAVRLNECPERQIWVIDSRMFEFQYYMVKKYLRKL
ncbi:hypothetical protein VR5_236 [Escherichia phage vb_EcoM-VR5]|uniref:Uncharacterized protein n=1 Tax=Escherichia phage vb_EcoM-VR5 TaxID=1567026 RepID=A0A0A7HBM9_9CAUD|nr:hypothetical protein AVV69_gp172 [Escherichia phage vb_EcoM-VR5]AIZ02023.1 hypothetical protein VR5_236 [Escherichia phage vb_EcoM-VR5]